jgi:GNAT-family acetyltransferase (TIGR03103 family)
MNDPLTDTEGAILNCGWGRLLFAHTFPNPESLAREVLKESAGQRDIAFYLVDPHLVLNYAPQQLFLDPSNTYRLRFDTYQPSARHPIGFSIGPLLHKEELDEINRIYQAQNMVPLDADFVWQHREHEAFTYILARADQTGEVLGVTMGVNHGKCFDDLRGGSSLWALAVDPKTELPGVGEWLVRYLIEYYRSRGCKELDLSVMHDNVGAQRLYQKLGFEKVAVFAVKNRNRINEKLFVGAPAHEGYNPYASILINEALRRGIVVEPIDPKRGYFKLSLGGRTITCRESLTDMTTAIALSRTDDKQLTRELLTGAGLRAPDQIVAGSWRQCLDFLNLHKSVVVKPLHGEQGRGISVDVRTPDELKVALALAEDHDDTVLIEQFCEGHDLRIIVIGSEVVAAAVRKPPVVVGSGTHTIEELIKRLSRRRSAATGGESQIPLDAETRRCVQLSGYKLDTVLPAEETLQVRKTANLHTGGVIIDVTDKLHPELARAATQAAGVIEIPVVGFDFIVPKVDGPDYVIIEANERPGLANHEPQPTAEKFIDTLFPQTVALATPDRT